MVPRHQGPRVDEPHDDEGEDMDVFIQNNVVNLTHNVANVFANPDLPRVEGEVEGLRQATGQFAHQVEGAIQHTQAQVERLAQGAQEELRHVHALARRSESTVKRWTEEAEKHLNTTALHLQKAFQGEMAKEHQALCSNQARMAQKMAEERELLQKRQEALDARASQESRDMRENMRWWQEQLHDPLQLHGEASAQHE